MASLRTPVGSLAEFSAELPGAAFVTGFAMGRSGLIVSGRAPARGPRGHAARRERGELDGFWFQACFSGACAVFKAERPAERLSSRSRGRLHALPRSPRARSLALSRPSPAQAPPGLASRAAAVYVRDPVPGPRRRLTSSRVGSCIVRRGCARDGGPGQSCGEGHDEVREGSLARSHLLELVSRAVAGGWGAAVAGRLDGFRIEVSVFRSCAVFKAERPVERLSSRSRGRLHALPRSPRARSLALSRPSPAEALPGLASRAAAVSVR